MNAIVGKSFSPLLDSILYGGSSVSMNLASLSREAAPETWLFSSHALNGAILFKYPNFPDRMPSGALADWSGGAGGEEDFRPIETGIYIPYDARRPRDGGSAIYMRQKNCDVLLQDYLGIKAESGNERLRRDLDVLMLLDNVPSLDPFLIKDYLDSQRIAFDPAYLQLNEKEVAQIRQMISVKIAEIIDKAFAAGKRAAADRDRVMAALWNPALPEARDFIAAFGISEADAPVVFAAWKGITFYQVQLRAAAPRIAEMIRWFAARESIPYDAAMNRTFMDQLVMFRERIVTQLKAQVDETRTIMHEYDGGHAAFLGGKPRRLITFLKGARRTYWLLASCLSALNSSASIFFTDVKPSRNNRLSFEESTQMFQKLDIVLSRKREVPTSF